MKIQDFDEIQAFLMDQANRLRRLSDEISDEINEAIYANATLMARIAEIRAAHGAFSYDMQADFSLKGIQVDLGEE